MESKPKPAKLYAGFGFFILLKVYSLQKKAKIFNTEQTELTKLKGVFQALPSLFALFSPC